MSLTKSVAFKFDKLPRCIGTRLLDSGLNPKHHSPRHRRRARHSGCPGTGRPRGEWGDEYEVRRTARDALKSKVKRLVFGTHSRKIEQDPFNELTEQGWFLEADESCKYRQYGRQIQLHLDGCQVWRNTAFD